MDMVSLKKGEFIINNLKLSKDYFGFKGSFNFNNRKNELIYVDQIDLGFSSPQSNKIFQIITKGNQPKTSHSKDELFLAGYIWEEVEKERGIIKHLKEALKENKLNSVRAINGQFSGGLLEEKSIILFRTIHSPKNIFYIVVEDTLYFSTSYMDLVSFVEFDEGLLPALCWGEDVLPFNGINILEEGEVLTFDEDGIMIETFDFLDQMSSSNNINDLIQHFKEIFSESLFSKITHYNSPGLMLSGGIDSSIVIGALYKGDYDLSRLFTYTWGSNKFTSCNDFKYVSKIKDMHTFNENFIDVGEFEQIDMLDMCSSFILPSNHCLSSWWMSAVSLANSNKNTCIISGLKADTLFDTFKLRPKTTHLNLREKFHLFLHGLSVPYYNYFWNNSNPYHNYKFNGVDSRGIDIFTEKSKQQLSSYMENPYNNFNSQYLTLDYEVFYPNGIVHFSPFNDRKVHSFANSLQDIYKRFPFQGKDISKPILRAAYIEELPHEVYSRISKSNFEEVIYRYVETNKEKILNIFKKSFLLEKEIIDYENIQRVFNNRDLLELNTGTILISAMIELWISQFKKNVIKPT
ncbi:asparagine synthase-related protein [Paenibacillus sp. TC-CSREp1]|uniref:asparagine synthase-related protein n=1 Tax=Paenibacillus sp. TC-CSREp1 TaxID=3410089 RepID=UPI003CF46C2C